jgi:hypothetical protein
LVELLAEDRDALLLLDGVLSSAADWEKAEAARKPDYLAHRGSRLSDAQALSSRGPDWERQLHLRRYLAAWGANNQLVLRKAAWHVTCKAEEVAVRENDGGTSPYRTCAAESQVDTPGSFSCGSSWTRGRILAATCQYFAAGVFGKWADQPSCRTRND